MSGYIIRRVIVAIIVTIGIAVISFLLLHYLSPSPVYAVLGAKTHAGGRRLPGTSSTGSTAQSPRSCCTYLGHLVQLNFGYSYKLGQSVSALFKENAGRSAYLTAAALVLSLVIAIPLGILQAVRRNTSLDYTFTTLELRALLDAVVLPRADPDPVFSLGTITTIFPPVVSDNITTAWQAFTHPVQLTLPIVTLAAINVASFSRYMRSSALDNLAQDYIRLARAKGLWQRAVLFRHLLRNACLPMITLIGLSIPTLLAGNLLIEYLFNYPGLGAAVLQGARQPGLQHPARLHDPRRHPDGPRQPARRHRDHIRRPSSSCQLIHFTSGPQSRRSITCAAWGRRGSRPRRAARSQSSPAAGGWRCASSPTTGSRSSPGCGARVLRAVLLRRAADPPLQPDHQQPAGHRPWRRAAVTSLGTDDNGFDELGRIMLGGQTALEIGFLAAAIATVIGTLWGAIAGLAGRARRRRR